MKLYYYENSERKGPIASVRLRELARNGEITPDTIVENEFGNKTEASKIGALISGLSLEKEFATSEPTPDVATPEIAPVESKKEPARPEPTPEPTAAPEFVPPKIDDQSIDLETSAALDLNATAPAESDPYKYASRAEPMKIDVPEVVRARSPKPTPPEPTPEPPKSEPSKTPERPKTEPPKKPEPAPTKPRRVDPSKDPFDEINDKLREEIRRRREEISKPAPRANVQSAETPLRTVVNEEKPEFRPTSQNAAPTPAQPAQAQKGGSSCLYWIVVVFLFISFIDVFQEHPGFFVFFVCAAAAVAWFMKHNNKSKKP